MGHPLIHLGYSYELNARNVGIEALGLAACFYSDLHKYVDDASYTKPADYQSDDPLKILKKVEHDTHFDGLFDHKGSDNIDTLLEKRESEVLNHWNAWQVSKDPKKQFELAQRAATALVVATHDGSEDYDFFLLHLLTSSHAVRILLPIVPAKFQVSLVRQWWLFTLLAYIAQSRPNIDLNRIMSYDTHGKGWKNANQLALHGEHCHDAHYVKGQSRGSEPACPRLT